MIRGLEMKEYVLSIDRGTTQIKVCLVDNSGQQVAVVSRPSPKMVSSEKEWYEQDMNEIYDETASAIQDMLSYGYSAENIKAVGVTGQGNGIFLIDKAGLPIRPAIMPMDERASAICESMDKKGISSQIKQINFFGVPSCSPLALLNWIKDNEPEKYEKICYVLSCKDWIRFRLTGEVGTDITDTSGAGLVDMQTGTYSNRIFKLADLEGVWKKMPEIHAPFEIAGMISKKAEKETGLKTGTPVVYGAHDIAACALGTGMREKGDLAIAAGTFGICLGVLSEPQLIGKYSTTLKHVLPDKWLSHYSIRAFGNSLDWFIRLLCEEEIREAQKRGLSVYTVLEEKIDVSKTVDILVRPYIYGSMTGEDAGDILRIRPWHTKADIIQSIYQGLAYAFTEAIQWYREALGTEKVYICGGGAKSRVIGQLIADVSGIPVYASTEKEETCKGAALCAWMGLDRSLGSELIRNASKSSNIWKPNVALYEKHQENLEAISKMNQHLWRSRV